MNPFSEQASAAKILETIRAGGKSPLGPGDIVPGDWRRELETLSDEALLGVSSVSDRKAAACVRAGLLLMGNDLEGSHDISQGIPSAEGSFWHGIMHRREPDYGNSKYWFRRVGGHELYRVLAANASGAAASRVVSSGNWDPYRFVDLVESCERGQRGEDREELMELQDLEMRTLLEWVYQMATGGKPGTP